MSDRVPAEPEVARAIGRTVQKVPPTAFFATSAVFHYLGPSIAVLLFAHVAVLGVAWLRIATAAVVFAVWRRPWRLFVRVDRSQRLVLAGLGLVLATMNSLFYLAIDRLPLSTVGAIEFLGTVVLAAVGVRSRRNLVALALAVVGVFVLTDVRLADEPLGFVFAFANCVGFMLYVMLAHRIANTSVTSAGAGEPVVPLMSGIDQLAVSMLIAAAAAAPFGVLSAVPAFTHPTWLVWGIAVGVLLGDSLRHRSARDGTAPARHLRADAGAASGFRHDDRPRRPEPGPDCAGPRRCRLGDLRCRPPP